jgi:hypothetical protein
MAAFWREAVIRSPMFHSAYFPNPVGQALVALCTRPVACLTKLVLNDEAETGRIIGEAPLPTLTGFAFKPIDEITRLKNLPRVPFRMRARAIAMARWLLPVPVPSMSETLRCPATNAPPARSRMSVSLTGVPVKSKSLRSLASGSFAVVSWYLIERAASRAKMGK